MATRRPANAPRRRGAPGPAAGPGEAGPGPGAGLLRACGGC